MRAATVKRHPRTGYPLMSEDDRIIATLAGEAPSCATCQWAEGGSYGPLADSWRTARCERRFIELMDSEYVRWPGGKAPYRNDHRDDAACGAGTVRRTEWIARLKMNLERRDPGDARKHDRWWQDRRPWLGEGNQVVEHPPCIHWRSKKAPRLDITDVWADLDKEGRCG